MGNKKKEYGLGGTLGKVLGTGAGAVIGSFVGNPMMGAKLGGMAGGAIGGDFDNNPQRQGPVYRPANRPTMPNQGSHGYAGGGYMKEYAKGGFSIGQDARKFSGPRHEQGGIPLSNNAEVEGGETMDFVVENGTVKRSNSKKPYIFSDRLQVPGSNKTFADYHEQLVSRSADDTQITQLARMQEQVSGRSANPNMSTRKKALGGPIGNDTIVDKHPESARQMTTNQEDSNEGMSTMDYVGMGLNVLPHAVNLGRGIFGKEGTRRAQYNPIPGTSKRYLEDMNTDYNVNPQVEAVRRSERAILSNPNASQNQKLAARSQSLQNIRRILAQKENRESQMENEQSTRMANTQLQIDRQNAATQNRISSQYAQDRMASDAARSNLISSGLAGMSQSALRMMAERAAREGDQTTLNAIFSALSGPVAENLREQLGL